MFGRARAPLYFVALASGAALAALPSVALGALPAGYDVQRVDSPNITVGGDFGIAMVSPGDLNGDGEQDIVIGTDEHGGSVGQIFVLSGEDGSTIRTINAPDTGGTGTLESFGSYVGGLADLGSCSGGSPGTTCGLATIGAPDGVPEILVTALGVDVTFTDPDTGLPATLVDAGRAYVIDGATGAVLKRVQMPVQDLDDQLDSPGGAKKPAFGRTVLSPMSQFGTANGAPPTAVQKGDVTGDGSGDFIVDASDYFETGATANPQSDCGAQPSNECLQAGRGYLFRGEDVAGSNPATILDAPLYTVKNPAAQADDLTTPVNTNRENLGYSIAPVGDLGKCNINPGPGMECTNANSTGTPDGRPDIALSSHRTDDFGMFDVGVFMLLDGTNGSVLYTYQHPEPQPASLFAFSNYNQPAFGDLGQSTAPDIYQAAMRQNNPYTGGGKGYVMNGAFKQGGSPNSISFSTMVDPTPHPSEDFGTSSAGIGNVFGDSRNELLIGAYGPHNPGTNPDVINDVHIFDPIHEVPLQTIPAPDQQPGLGFGTSLAPLGDLNEDGFLDFAVGAGLFDGTATGGGCPTPPALCADTGRVYIFRSSNAASPPASGTTPGTTPAVVLAARGLSLDASKNKVRKGKKFALRGTLTSPVNPGSCAAGQSVTLERAKPRSSAFKPFANDTTDGGGAFSLKVKAKRTFVYKAHVDATNTCAASDSNREKVKVRKVRKR
jgi:FG-GAP repeat